MRRILNTLLGLSLTIGADAKAGCSKHHGHEVQHPNHIFNAIHSSMRQWGSSLNHNGMSLFVATVPQGTQLYHGTNKANRINGTEWLAFEPEHALVFARSHRGPPGRGGPPPPGHGPDDDDEKAPWHPPQATDGRPKYMPWHEEKPKADLKPRHEGRTGRQRQRAGSHQDQGFMEHDDGPSEESHGYLHTYRPKHQLRLLYIDGQSAAKSSKGTLDTQDILLLHDNPPPSDGDHRRPRREEEKPKPGGPMSESFRAEHLCKIAKDEWEGKIDGFLRMELGFEIILCSFERDLDVERIAQVKDSGMGGGPGGPGGSIAYYKAVASRFDGIGGERVHVNYDNFVTAFDSGAIHFDIDSLPRIRNDTKLVHHLQKEIKHMVLQEDPVKPTNWQAIADMVIARYADHIEYLASGDLQDLSSIQAEIEPALRPFIDYGKRDRKAEVHRCAAQYIPLPSHNNLAAAAIMNITTTICVTLFEMASSTSCSETLDAARELKAWLAWTTWKKCKGGCSYNEVCFVPIWPMGGKEELEHPKCVSNMSETSRGYWGGFGPREHSHEPDGAHFD